MTFPFFGAIPERHGVRFRVMVTTRPDRPQRRVELVVHSGHAAGSYLLERADAGVYETWLAGAAAGDRYSYRLDSGDLYPDPGSRFQPDGIHAHSEIVDPRRYVWGDSAWAGRAARERVVYELHVGTFTREGTFEAARHMLPQLQALGVTMIELMPVADFAGLRNWGYDGVSLFAPSRAYGRPDDLRALVDDAHALGLGVMLDVVYNHLGPEGAYLTQFNPGYLTDRHSTPWGAAVNLDGCGSNVVRRFIIDNAMHWIHEYHLDGLRLDATHALIDESPVHVVAEIADHVRRTSARPITLHAEDHRNLSTLVQDRARGGWGLDGVWADDFHHVMRRMLAGDSYAYYQDFEGTAGELARTIQQGWLYTGELSKHLNAPRGTDASAVPMHRCIVCLQNHDQVGNRAAGDRVHHDIDLPAWRAASVLLLTAPTTPLLFMGQEWGASTPFLFFTDLEPALGQAVTEGRRREFKDFPEFADETARQRIPDPQALCTFQASKLRWEERRDAPHASILALYNRLLALRAAHPALQASECGAGQAWAAGGHAVVMRRSSGSESFLIVASFGGHGEIDFTEHIPAGTRCDVVLTTEDAPFAADSQPPRVAASSIAFERAGAVMLRLHA